MMSLPRKQLLAEAVALLLFAAVVVPVAQAGENGIDLGNLGSGGFRIDGIDVSDLAGRSVSGAGDVNGDGLADVIVGAFGADPGGDSYAGESYVVFGKASSSPIDLSTLNSGGFRIEGIDAQDYSGLSVSGAGDVNGDGLADLIVGAYGADPNGSSDGGESYVVFGKSSSTPVNLANLGSGGFRIDGIDMGDISGRAVAGAGDVNGDGLADLIIGADTSDPGDTSAAGESFVVFGKASSTPVDLATLDSGGFRIDGINASDQSGRCVSGAGDVNGDGLADLIVGAFGADPDGAIGAGESYVIFGKVSSTAVELAALGSSGFRIKGIASGDGSGFSVSGAGDINGDGLADLIVGASRADPGGNSSAGESYVVFGKTDSTPVNLANLGSGGFRVEGVNATDFSGFSVSGAGDVNGDGLADLIVGAPYAHSDGESYAGKSYLVFGKNSSTMVDLGNLDSAGFRMDGVDRIDYAGFSVSGAGDVNGDGLADLIVGAFGADPGGDSDAGESYVVFSPSMAPVSAAYRVRSRNGNPPQTVVGVTGDGSNASHPDARAWIDFDDGADLGGSASTDTITLNRNAGNFNAAAANVQWQLQTTRVNYTSVEVMFRYLDSELNAAEQDLQLVFSPNGSAPFTTLSSVLNTQNNTISAVTQAGFFYLGAMALSSTLLRDGFEQPPGSRILSNRH